MDHDAALLVNDTRTDLAKREEEITFQNNVCNRVDNIENVVINRAWYTKSSFDVVGDYKRRKIGYKDRLKACCFSCCPKNIDVWKLRMLSLFPFLNILKSYGKNDFLCDIIAGLTVGVMHIPQGMAYGILANIDPVFGLYTSFFSIFIYFIFGTSRHISIGVFAVVSLMVGSVVDRADCSFDLTNSSQLPFESSLNYTLSTEYTHIDDFIASEIEKCKVRHALTVTFIVGIIQLLMGIFHFGFVTVYLSDPLTRGLITGAGVHVFSSQIKHVFGISLGRFNGPLKLVFLYKNCFEEIKNTNPAPLVVCLVCIVIIYCLQRWVSPKMKKYLKIPIPAELLMLIVGTLLSHFLKFPSPSVFNMKVVGNIPTGLPTPQPPDVFLIPKVLIDAVAISVVTFTINISMAKMFSVKHGYKLDSNQELVAYGMTNMIGSFFNSYVSTASLSRTLVQESTGGKTQVASLVASMLLLVVLLFVGPLFRDLPNCVLAAVIIVNLRGIFMQVLDIRYLKRISTSDMLTWVVTCVAVILTDVDFGLVIGLSFSFLTVVIRNQAPKVHELGNISGTELYEDIKDYKKAIEIDRIKIFSLDTSLFYANAEHFQTTILENILNVVDSNEVELKDIKVLPREENGVTESVVDQNAREGSGEVQSLDVIVDCGRMSFVDDVGIKALNIIAVELMKRNMRMSLTHCSSCLNHTLRKAMELKKLKKCQIFCTNHDAVKCLSNDHHHDSQQSPTR